MLSGGKVPRVVVDTNIFVSGTIIKRGNPFELLEAWRKGLFTLVLSEEQRAEVEEVLVRLEIQKRYALSPNEVAGLLELLDTIALKVQPRRRLPVKVRDKKDEIVLATALGGNADFLVSGDNDLLVLRNEPRLASPSIVTAREFLEILRSTS